MTTGNLTAEGTREQWGSRLAFYFTAIGAAVGFGNVWRFPSLAVKYGGGTFFIPYLLALVFVGIPILILEIGFGQFFQTGDVNVFGGFHPRMRGVGVGSVACGFMLVTYYSVLIAWVVNAFFSSWTEAAPWDEPNLNGTTAVNYFIDEVIGAKTLGDDGRPTRMVWANVGYSVLVWAVVFFGTAFGVKWTGRITYFTMGFPIVLLFVFLITALTLEGHQDGVVEYIGRWDLSVLSTMPDMWSTAVSQIFFSIGVTFGIMTAFGSYCPKTEPVVLNSCVIALSNSMFSFLSGFAVFAALGHLAFRTGSEVLDLDYAGFALVFGTWPVVLTTLPGGAHWVRLLFFDLFLLGIDSAFAFVEAIVTVLLDTTYCQNMKKWQGSLGFCVSGFLLSLIYATDAGLNFLDVIDFYINFVMLLVGFFECFAAGWVYGWKRTIDECGLPAFINYLIANFGSVFIGCAIWFGVPNENALWGGFVAMFGWWLVFTEISIVFLALEMPNHPDKTWSDMLWELSFKNVFDLKERIEPVTKWIPGIWCILIKQILPHLLIVLFINLAQSDTSAGLPVFGNYGGYVAAPFQVLGILVFFFTLFLVSIGLFFPKVYLPLALPPGHAALDPEEMHKAETTNNGEGEGSDYAKSPDGEKVEVQNVEPEEVGVEEIGA